MSGEMENLGVTSDWRRSVSAPCLSALTFRSSASLARLASISAFRLSDIDMVYRGNLTQALTCLLIISYWPCKGYHSLRRYIFLPEFCVIITARGSRTAIFHIGAECGINTPTNAGYIR